MVMHFDSNNGGWYESNYKTEIHPVEQYDEPIIKFYFQWPQFAIDEVNKLIKEHNMPLNRATEIVSKTLVR